MVKGMNAAMQEGRVLRRRTPAIALVVDVRTAIAALGPVAKSIVSTLPQAKPLSS